MYISNKLLSVMETVAGKSPVVMPVTQQNITPYGNGLFHINATYPEDIGKRWKICTLWQHEKVSVDWNRYR